MLFPAGLRAQTAGTVTITTSTAPVLSYSYWGVVFVGTGTPPPPPVAGTVTGAGSVATGSTVTLVATPSTNWNFTNWTESGTPVSTSATYAFTATADRTLVANFTLQSYTITATSSSATGGVTSGGGTFAYNTWVSLVASPAPGYDFVNWTENGTAVSSQTTMSFTATAPRTLVANFAIKTYTVSATASPSDGGTVTGGGTFNHGASVKLVATPAAGYYFANWSENGTEINWARTLNFTATGNRTLVANFTKIVPISGGANFSGATIFAGVTLSAGTLDIGYSGGSVTINTGALIWAGTTVPVSYNITANVLPASGGSVAGAGSVYAGASITLLATPAAGFTFANWTEDGTVVGTSASYTFTVGGNRTVVANFTGSSNANLASLMSDQAAFTQAFDGNVTTYSTHVSSATKYFTVSPTLAQDGATIKINGTAASTGGSSPAVQLNLGRNTLAIEVTAPDGVTTKTYTLTITRSEAHKDLDGDGNSELIFQNTAGQIGAWYTDASGTPTFSAYLYAGGLGDWKVVGTADMNGDGNADLIFQNTIGQVAVWHLDGRGVTTSAAFIYSGGLGDWRVVGTGDMNGDGNADLIFQNSIGQIGVWYMDGHGAFTSSAFIYSGGLGDWRIAAIGDMNGDGNADLIFQNSIGQIGVWYMDGHGAFASSAFIYSGGLGDWRVVDAADMNGDGNADLIFQNNIGQIGVWHMNGHGTFNSSAFIYSGGLGDWRIR